MIHIELPTHLSNFSNILDECCKRQTQYINHVINNKYFLLQKGEEYYNLARVNDLHLFNINLPVSNIIIGQLTNEHLVNLYNYCLVKQRCGNIYDNLINLAKNPNIYCPFCGGINKPSQIDHFLPKARYGHFSVYPYNLIPICSTCNSEYKKSFFPINKEEQLIHAYLDDDCFFSDRWLYARYIDDIEYGTIEYYVDPPETWTDDKKSKVIFHFKTFKLAERFSEKACEPLSDLLTQMKAHKVRNGLLEDFEEINIDSIIQKQNRINHWKKVAFLAIKDNISSIWDKIEI